MNACMLLFFSIQIAFAVERELQLFEGSRDLQIDVDNQYNMMIRQPEKYKEVILNNFLKDSQYSWIFSENQYEKEETLWQLRVIFDFIKQKPNENDRISKIIDFYTGKNKEYFEKHLQRCAKRDGIAYPYVHEEVNTVLAYIVRYMDTAEYSGFFELPWLIAWYRSIQDISWLV